MRGSSVLIVAMSGAIAGAASGQLAPPPPKQSPKEDLKYIAAPPPPPRPPVPPPIRDEDGHVHQSPTRAPQAPPTPDLAFVPLVQVESDGRAIPVGGQIAMAALKHNPLVGAETIETVRPVVVKWVDRLDLMVIDNIDMVLEINEGFFETLDFMVQEDFMTANVYRNALMPMSLLHNHLFAEGVLTDAQNSFCGKLIGDYIREMTIAIGHDVESARAERIAAENAGVPREMNDEEAAEMRREFVSKGAAFTFAYFCSDAVWSMKRQLAFASEHLDEILPELNLDDEQMAAFKSTQEALSEATDADKRTRLMADLITPWEFPNQEALLLTALNIRGPLETLPELDDAVNKPNGLPPREDLKHWKPGDPIDASDDSGSDKNTDDGG